MRNQPDDLFVDPRGYKNTMIPADAGINLGELVRITLYNIEQFDKVAMDGEQTLIGRSTVELTHRLTYRQRFEDALARIAAKNGWSHDACMQIADLKKRCPPDRLYRIRGGFHSATRGLSPLGIVVSYRPGKNGGPAEVGVAVLGTPDDQIGSARKPFGVPREALEDVTADARAGNLPELRRG